MPVTARAGNAMVPRLVFPRVIAILLALSLLPSVEIVEAAVHLVVHGDAAHGGGHDDSGLGQDEHGCSGTFHVCSCHTGSVLPHAFAVELSSIPATSSAPVLGPVESIGRGTTAPPIRPPIA